MRKIKFRGKRKDTGMWIVGALIPNGKKKACIAPFKELFHLDEVVVETVGQFTGLHDTDGREIYEGDIIKGKLMSWHTICYDEENARFIASFFNSPNNCCSLTQHWINECSKVVIGNIHDNLELIR